MIDVLTAVDIIGRSIEPPLPVTKDALPYAELPDGVWKVRARALSLLMALVGKSTSPRFVSRVEFLSSRDHPPRT